MKVDGKVIAAELYDEVKNVVVELPRTPKLSAITCAPNFETRSYLELKKRKAAEVSIDLNVVELSDEVKTDDLIRCIQRLLPECDGIVVQLPLPTHIDREAVLAAVPPEKDPDGFSYETSERSCLPPVVGAIEEIARRNGIEWENKNVVVVGYGRLVGRPAAYFAETKGAKVVVLEEGDDISKVITADIIITGVGQPHLITKQMVKEGVIVFDAGTSEESGLLAGDVDPNVAKKASLLTPVPGGIGPITVAVLFKNLVSLVRQ